MAGRNVSRPAGFPAPIKKLSHWLDKQADINSNTPADYRAARKRLTERKRAEKIHDRP